MNGRRRVSAGALVITLICLIGASALPVAAGTAATGDTQPVDVAGARLVVLDSESADQGSIFAVMLAGIGAQRPDETHIAHVSEHMTFMNPGPDGRTLAQFAIGVKGIFNGWTGPDHTQFELTVPTADIPAALERLIAGLFAQQIDPAALRAELTNRLTPELKYMTSNSISAPLNASQLALCHGTRYYEPRFTVPVTTATAEAVAAFRAREYSPARLVIIVCAQVDRELIAGTLAAALAGVPAGAPPVDEPVTLSPAGPTSMAVSGGMAPCVVAGLAFNDIKPEQQLGAHLAALLIGNRTQSAGIQGLRPSPVIFGAQSLNGAEGLLIGFTPTGLSALMPDAERLMAAARGGIQSAFVSLREQGPTDGELADIAGSLGAEGSYPDEVPRSLTTAFNAGLRFIPAQGQLLRLREQPLTKEQVAAAIAGFLADCTVTDPFSVYLEGETYARTVLTRTAIGLVVLVAAAYLVWRTLTRRRRRTA
ncbi:MAG: insulinase family protein [Chloroflexota bacterium]